MFELPEFVTLSRQVNDTLKGKTIQRGVLGNSPHKFLWYNRSHDEFEKLAKGKAVGEAWVQGKWLLIPLEPGYVLLLGECGGKVLYHPEGSKLPAKYHLYISFEDGSFLTAITQMWGAMDLYEKGEEQHREYIRGMRTTPVDPAFTYAYFTALLDELAGGKKRSAKSLLTQDQMIPGLGNAIAQDILFRARLHPRHPIEDLEPDQRWALYDAIVDTVQEAIEKGGRYDEFDLFGNRGGYIRLMDKNAFGRPCPECGGEVEKIQYLGGACYLCSNCQH
ncbi:MAG: DNA-formamidopyrimidine glycosylase family protein [Anaerolineales bacterium]|jgi:formamidopyrimidine-DNA glycosylase